MDSEPGKGSTFWFTARLAIGEEKHHKLIPEETFSSNEANLALISGADVLLVEDNENNDSEAADLLANNSDLLEAAFGEQCRDIKTAIADFNFDKALFALAKAMK